VHKRIFAAGALPSATILGELPNARSRRLTQAYNKPATLTFTVDGHSPSASAVGEMTTDVIAWRWNDTSQSYRAMFRGIVTASNDTLSEQSAVVTFTCQDYLAMLARRFWTGASPFVWTQFDQDTIASGIISQASSITDSSGATSFAPGSFLPLVVALVDPAGNNRGLSGQLRDRTYQGQTSKLDGLNGLATVVNGFDYDCQPLGSGDGSADVVSIYYPYQGILRTRPQLVYGVTVSALTRTFNSTDYANYQRSLGNNGNAAANAPQVFGEAWNSDTNNVTTAPQGLWMTGDLAADVSVQSTLNDHANGNLARSGVVVPSYTVTLRPGWFVPGPFNTSTVNMGEVVPLVINEGRLHVNTTVRILGIDYVIGDDGQEDVVLTLGRPDVTIQDLFNTANADVDALARR
jgi:hypothetical protein